MVLLFGKYKAKQNVRKNIVIGPLISKNFDFQYVVIAIFCQLVLL